MTTQKLLLRCTKQAKKFRNGVTSAETYKRDGKSTKILFNRKYSDFRFPDSIKALIGQVADIHLPELIPQEIDTLPNTIEFNLSRPKEHPSGICH